MIAKGVRLLCTNTVGKNSKMVVLRTQGSSSMKDNIITVFGPNTFKCLEPFSVTTSDGCQIEGFLSKPGPGTGRSSGDRQFFYVNGRPIDMPKVTKLVNELYKSSNAKQYPVVILDFRIPTTSYDVNVAPDKRKVFFSSESMILQSLREAVENLYSPVQCSFSVNHIKDPEKEGDAVTDGHNEDTNAITMVNVSASSISDEDEETDSEDHVSPENQKLPPSVAKLAIEATSRDASPLSRGTATEADRSAWLPSFAYEQPKRSPKERKSSSLGTNRFRTGVAANSTHSSTIQSSLMNFVSLNKRKHEDDCTFISEAPVLRRGTCSEQVRRSSLEANFATPKKQNLEDDCIISEAPVLRSGTCSELDRRTSLEVGFASPNQKHDDDCTLISETPVLRRGANSEQARGTSLEANLAPALNSSTYNISKFNLPLETNFLKQHPPQSFGSVRTDVSPQHYKQPNIVTLEAEVSGPCDVHTSESDVVGKLCAVRYRVLQASIILELLPVTYMCSCSYVACSPVICESSLVKCFACWCYL